MKKRFVFSAHTADVFVKVTGGSLKELFISSALAMVACSVEKTKNRTGAVLEEVVFELKEEALEDLLKGWLDELLYFFSTKGLVLARVKSLEFDEQVLRACVLFDKFDERFYQKKNEIKAVTYHELKVEKTRSGWRAQMIFDV
ncbi:MAG: archease [Candidatus Omnitrophota bacterium]